MRWCSIKRKWGAYLKQIEANIALGLGRSSCSYENTTPIEVGVPTSSYFFSWNLSPCLLGFFCSTKLFTNGLLFLVHSYLVINSRHQSILLYVNLEFSQIIIGYVDSFSNDALLFCKWPSFPSSRLLTGKNWDWCNIW